MSKAVEHQGCGYYLEGINGIDDLSLDQDTITIDLYVIGNKSRKSSGFAPGINLTVDKHRYKEIFNGVLTDGSFDNELPSRLSFNASEEQLIVKGGLTYLELNLRAIRDIVFEANKLYTDELMTVGMRHYARQLEARF